MGINHWLPEERDKENVWQKIIKSIRHANINK